MEGTKITHLLRQEHADLQPHVEVLRTAAESITTAVPPESYAPIDKAIAVLTRRIIPHVSAEDKALYPVVEETMGAFGATNIMRRDHVEIVRLADELAQLRAGLSPEGPSTQQADALRRVLYGLYALVQVHFAKEEELYLPILDAKLTIEQAAAMFAAMADATEQATPPPPPVLRRGRRPKRTT